MSDLKRLEPALALDLNDDEIAATKKAAAQQYLSFKIKITVPNIQANLTKINKHT